MAKDLCNLANVSECCQRVSLPARKVQACVMCVTNEHHSGTYIGLDLSIHRSTSPLYFIGYILFAQAYVCTTRSPQLPQSPTRRIVLKVQHDEHRDHRTRHPSWRRCLWDEPRHSSAYGEQAQSLKAIQPEIAACAEKEETVLSVIICR